MNTLLVSMGAVVMVSGGVLLTLALLFLLASALGVYAHHVYKKLCRTYALHVVWYWMQRVEKEGRSTFEKAPDTDDY